MADEKGALSMIIYLLSSSTYPTETDLSNLLGRVLIKNNNTTLPRYGT
jgi:hypothetical protein